MFLQGQSRLSLEVVAAILRFILEKFFCGCQEETLTIYLLN